MSLLKMPEVGSPEYIAMLEGIPAMLEARTASNKARFAPMVQAAGLNPDTYDYANIQPEIFDKIGSQDARALKLSTMDYGNQERVNDFDAYTGAAGRVISGGLTDDQMWADYDKNKYRQSDFQNMMKGGIKAGLGAMVGAGIGDAAGMWNLGGETAAMAPGQVSALNPVNVTGSAQSLSPSIAMPELVATAPIDFAALGAEAGIGVMPELGASTLPTLGGSISSGYTPMATMANPAGGVWNTLKSGVSAVNDLTGGNLGGIVGGLLGAAASKDTTTSQSKDPWGPAQPYLKENLARNQRMQDYYAANPFSTEQKAAYQGLLDTNANGLSNAGNFNQIANNFMGSTRGLMGQMPTLNTGVKAPTVDWSKYSNIGKV